MEHIKSVLLVMLLQLHAYSLHPSASDIINYVKPEKSPPSITSCPGQPCLTLYQYTAGNNFTTGTTLLFMPGNHSLELTLNLTGISNITLKKMDSNSTANIICTNVGAVYCENITDLKIVGLRFLLNFEGDQSTSALRFVNCNEIIINYATFERYGMVTGRAVCLQNTRATIGNCSFTGHNAEIDNGGAISLDNTNLTIYGSVFTGNSAWDDSGGAVYGFNSTLLMEENTFLYNFAVRSGGALCFYYCAIEMTGHNIFQGNRCYKSNDYDDYNEDDDDCLGGAIFTDSTVVTVTGKVELTHNEANRGGAIYSITTIVTLGGNTTLSDNYADEGGGMHYKNKAVF